MKELLFVLSTFLSVSLFAQIPNPGFELWEDYPDYGEECQPNPNVYLKPVDWVGSLPHHCDYSFSIERNNESYPAGTGQYSMIVKEDTIYGSNGIAFSLDEFAHWPFPPAFPINYRPTSLCLYYKYLPQYNDTMAVACLFYKQGVLIGNPGISISTTISEWTPLEVPLVYNNEEIPDSAAILITTGVVKRHHGSRIYVDNISFDTFITSQVPAVGLSVLSVFPNPARDYIKISDCTAGDLVKIYDIGGCVVKVAHPDSESQVHINDLSTGIYFVRISTYAGDKLQRFIKM